jgi:hypothetical protein
MFLDSTHQNDFDSGQYAKIGQSLQYKTKVDKVCN